MSEPTRPRRGDLAIEIMKYFERTAGKTVYSIDLEKALEVTHEQVSKCVQNLIKKPGMDQRITVIQRGQIWRYHRPEFAETLPGPVIGGIQHPGRDPVGPGSAPRPDRELFQQLGIASNGDLILEAADSAGTLYRATPL